jgi:hypothetical protein
VTISYVPPPPDPTSQPTRQPSSRPSNQPTAVPSSQPTCHPVSIPTTQPSSRPSNQPSVQPSRQPISRPTVQPSGYPSVQPSTQPISFPTRSPSNLPSVQPSSDPTTKPSIQPSSEPTNQPNGRPSSQPSTHPSSHPSSRPGSSPSGRPSSQPSSIPTRRPSSQPIGQPSARPSSQPTIIPSAHPSNQPTRRPSSQPSSRPNAFPSSKPTRSPTRQPSSVPSGQPSSQPSSKPFSKPTNRPSSQPTRRPSGLPSSLPSSSPSNQPSEEPSGQPSSQPSCSPTSRPSDVPSNSPTAVPSNQPSEYPTVLPSSVPSIQPSNRPTGQPSGGPSGQPSGFPSSQPTLIPSSKPSAQPTRRPSDQPTRAPSRQPSSAPTTQPSSFPSNYPTCHPSGSPTSQPTDFPTSQPSNKPTNQPTSEPSAQPTVLPTRQPSQQPSNRPTGSPSGQPSALPTNQPTGFPTNQPSNFPSSCPSRQPTVIPSCQPSVRPTNQPTIVPSDQPTSLPTDQPTTLPTCLPTGQPSRFPSVQPVSSPTSRPSSQPTSIPTAQPFAVPTSAPQATIYQTNGVLFYLGVTSSTNKTVENNNNLLGSSFILFGRNLNHQRRFPSTISLDSSLSHEFVSPITNGEAGIRSDPIIRSTTIVGDINGDGFLDLLVGYPLTSKCSVYLGDGVNDFATIITTKGESFAIIGDPYQGGGFLGWSSIRVGDLNGDGIDEIMISAIYANTIYVIYGRTHFEKTINILEEVTNNKKGFQIQGSDQETNFGVSITLLHHFRKGSHADIAVTAQRPTGAQCVVYILFGGVLFNEPIESVIAIDQIKNNPLTCLKIVTPLFSFAGFSLAGIGDINSDGYDDLAIGSVPYYKGSYVEQRTYILFGRVFNASERELDLSEMGEKDGMIITGGGFLVTGVGDVNGDNVADVMISSYHDWQGQKSAYLISIPANMTYSPSLQPSFSPTTSTTVPTRFLPFSNDSNSTSLPTLSPSFRPSFAPSVLNSSSTTRLPTRAVFAVGTARPSVGKPSLAPSLSPTSGYHHLRGFPTKTPTPLITGMPTINTTVFTEIDCTTPREDDEEYCRGNKNGTHSLFRITADTGILKIIGNEEEGAKNVYVLYCPKERVDVIIENFRLSTDIISVIHLSQEGYSYSSLDKISYSLKNGQPLTLLFCSNNKLQLILSSHTEFGLQKENFIFTQEDNQEHFRGKSTSRNTILAKVQIGIVFGVFFFLLCVFSALSYRYKLGKNEKVKQEEKLFQALINDPLEIEVNPLPESPSHSSSVSSSSSSSYSYDREENQSKYEENDDKSSTAVVIIDEYNEKNDELKIINFKNSPNNTNQVGKSLDRNHQSLSLTLPEFGVNQENNVITSINSDDWEDALAFSDDEEKGDDHYYNDNESLLRESCVSPERTSSASQLFSDSAASSSAYSSDSSNETFQRSSAEVSPFEVNNTHEKADETAEHNYNRKDIYEGIHSIDSDE